MEMKNYASKAKNALFEWAVKHNDFLQKWGERTKYAAVGIVGPAGYAFGRYVLNTEDPGILSECLVVPASVVFGIGESMKVLGEYSKDWKNDEIDPVKNAGYIARISMPVYAGISGSNGVWEGWHDVGIPIVTWVGGAGLTAYGEKRVFQKKLSHARKLADCIYGKTTENGARAIIGHMISEGKRRDEIAELLRNSLNNKKIDSYLKIWEK
jgi:hypothetical protein